MDMIGNVISALNRLAEQAKSDRVELNAGRIAQGMARRGYSFTEQSLKIVKAYASGNGIAISGGVGSGKTYFFVCLGLPILNLKVAQGKTVQEITRALDSYRDYPIVIDDVGVEDATYKSYGNEIGLVDYIVEMRIDSPAATHMTLNLSPEQLQTRYGDRLVDRITQLCEWHDLNCESHRDPSNGRRSESLFSDFFLGREWTLCANCCGWYDRNERRCLKGKTHEPRAFVRKGYRPEPSCPHFG